MKILEVKGKKFGVLGAARSGIAVAQLLKSRGAEVFVSEIKTEIDLSILRQRSIPFETGGHSDRLLDNDYVVLSPGIPFDSPIVQRIKGKGIPVFSELEVASWFCKAPIIAITGSNGKTTTTALLGEIFSKAGRERVVAGNIGLPFSDWTERVDERGVAILEVSSFQLEGIKSFKPRVSVLLNITPDHLDYHRSFQDYVSAKGRIMENQDENDFIVYNIDDEVVAKIVSQASSRAKRVPFSLQREVDYGGFLKDGHLVLQLNDQRERLIPVREIKLPGQHNLYNSLASALAARIFEIPLEAIKEGLRSFPGLEHRLEFVREVKGVKFINDSKATNVDAVWYALQSFQRPIILIAGGRDKGGDYSKLRELVSQRVRKLILIGEARAKIRKALGSCTEVMEASSLEEAVRGAYGAAQRGDVVLLSPACASFDMFRDFEDRGNRFKQLVWSL